MTKAKLKKKRLAKRRKLLKLWSELGRKDQCCQLCGKTDYLNAHHLFSKKFYKSLRYDITNRYIVCSSCHTFAGNTDQGSMHNSPVAVINWFLHHPEDYSYLCANSRKDIDLEDDLVLARIEARIIADKPYWGR